MTSPTFPEPPPSVAATPLEQVARAIDELAAHKDTWVKTEIPERIRLLRACIEGVLLVAPEWVEQGCRAKGIDPSSQLVGEEWLGGPMTVVRNCRLLIEALEAGGAPKPKRVLTREDGQIIAEVFPANTLEGVLYSGMRGEVWIEPGKEPSQGRIYREKAAGKTHPGKVSLVLGAGNIASIGAMDALYKLFAEDEVVLLKTNPVNAYVGVCLERTFAPLVDAGVLRVVHGGAEVGQFATDHTLVDTIHMTGSDRTHDAIVWGATPEEQARRKAAHDPKCKKPISSELGAVTPIFVVPGPWSDDDLEFQARHVASMVAHNGSFNCNAGKVLVLARGWALRDAFLDRVHKALAAAAPRKAYYPGAEQRYRAFLDHYPSAKVLGQSGESIVPWTVLPNVPAKKGEYALTNEAFCGVLAEVSLDVDDAPSFLRAIVAFGNDVLWGTLSCMMLVHPETERAHAGALERAIADLRYGGIGYNVWAGVVYGLVVVPWGAFPGHPLENIESGRGFVHNAFLFDHPQKAVVRGGFRIKPTPVWFHDHRTLAKIGPKLTRYEAEPSLLKVPGLVAAALSG